MTPIERHVAAEDREAARRYFKGTPREPTHHAVVEDLPVGRIGYAPEGENGLFRRHAQSASAVRLVQPGAEFTD